jgi:hypothetical protein
MVDLIDKNLKSGIPRLTLEQMNERIAKYGWEIIDKYEGSQQKGTIKCKKCGRTKLVRISSIYVTKCKCNYILKEFTYERVNNMLNECGFEVAGEIKTTNDPLDIKCKTCGTKTTLKYAKNLYRYKPKCLVCNKGYCVLCEKEFDLKNGKPRKFCYECYPDNVKKSNTAYQKAEIKYRKKLLKERYGSKCTICGYDKCFNALDFHHPNENKRNGELRPCVLVRREKMEEVFKELDKCQLVCANCHRELHAREK